MSGSGLGRFLIGRFLIRRFLIRPGGDLLSRALRRSTMGAEGFHGRVRNGIGCIAPRCGHQAKAGTGSFGIEIGVGAFGFPFAALERRLAPVSVVFDLRVVGVLVFLFLFLSFCRLQG